MPIRVDVFRVEMYLLLFVLKRKFRESLPRTWSALSKPTGLRLFRQLELMLVSDLLCAVWRHD
jgi:hypothetical protein